MIKSGRLAYSVDSQGRRRLDPAELGRVFDRDATHGNGAVQSNAAPQGDSAEIIALLLEDLRRRIDKSEAEREQIQERLTGLLTHRQAGSVPAVTPQAQRPWWRRWLR